MRSAPVVDQFSVEIPLAEIPFLVKAPSHECLAIWSPYTATDGLSKPCQGPFKFASLQDVRKAEINLFLELTVEFHKRARLSVEPVTINESSGLHDIEQTPDSWSARV
jgi:hypothetical protein